MIGQSGSALAGWAFDKEPEYHARRIARKVDCDLPDQEDLIQCLKNIPAINITLAHVEYRVRIYGSEIFLYFSNRFILELVYRYIINSVLF